MRGELINGVSFVFLTAAVACSDGQGDGGDHQSSDSGGTSSVGSVEESGGSHVGGGGPSGGGGAAAVGGMLAEVGGSASGGQPSVEDPSGGAPTGGSAGLVLEGDPPDPVVARATTEFFQLLPDDAEFTLFEGSEPFFVLPLQTENFRPGYDYCAAAGGDDELNEEQQWARAELRADLKTWYYDVTLVSVPEEDGETPYQLVIDGEVVREYVTPPTGTQGAEDRQDFPHTWERVPIESGQSVQLWSKAHSNLEITEGAACRTGAGFDETYAWARARWNGLRLVPAQDVSP